MLDKVATDNVEQLMQDIGNRAKKAARLLATATTQAKNAALNAAADAILAATPIFSRRMLRISPNVEGKGLLPSFIDRLTLNEKRVAEMAEGLRAIAALPDPSAA